MTIDGNITVKVKFQTIHLKGLKILILCLLTCFRRFDFRQGPRISTTLYLHYDKTELESTFESYTIDRVLI